MRDWLMSTLRYEQSKAFETSDSENSDALPNISIADLNLERIKFHYDSKPDGLMAAGLIDLFHVEMPVMDLNNSSFVIEEMILSNSDIAVRSTTVEKSKESQKLTEPGIEQKSTIDFTWPDIKADIQHVQLENNTFEYVVDDARITQGQFNPNAILLSDVDLSASRISLIDREVFLDLERLTFLEGSGIDLKELAMELSLTDSDASIGDLALRLNRSSIHSHFEASYPSINALLHDPTIAHFDLALSDLDLDLNEIFRFNPSLKSLYPIDILSKKRVRGHAEVAGNLSRDALQ